MRLGTKGYSASFITNIVEPYNWMLNKNSNVMGGLTLRNALKKRGMVPGMPDLAILKNQKIYFLEFKSKNGKLSENQQIIIDYLIAHDYDVAVVDNFDDTREMLKLWGIIG